jgi:hypothetical protein
MLKWKKHSRLTRYVSPTVYPQAFLLIGVYPFSAFLSICRCLLMDFGTHTISLLIQLPKRRSLGSMALPLENLGLGAID